MTSRLEQEDIHQLADRIWESMFGSPMERLAGEGTSDDERFLTGCVQLTGAWDGAAVVRCSYRLASQLAAMMLGAEDLALEEVCDAVGELANLTAGAVQALMPSPSELSPPSVVEGKEYKLVLPRCGIMNQAYFRFNDEPFTILVYEADKDPQLTRPTEAQLAN
ncbi:MAG TPA: chemotaxis protein CheX [Candidatus Binataceae bacterium]|nr:chemotaxis protein CheX [Candidatus Binataceae bacterium]